jgi:hypothetical protein
MYVELVEYKVTNRGKIIEYSTLDRNPANYERYISWLPYDKNILDYAKVNGSLKQYKGIHYCPVFFIDIDKDGDLAGAQQSTLQLIKRLVSEYFVNTEDLLYYFSGNKGFHVGIPGKMMGIKSPQSGMGDRCKRVAVELTNDIENIDYKIYDDGRLFRLVNSINDKSGLYKIPITYEELAGDMNVIIELAKQPRTKFSGQTPGTMENDGLADLWNRCAVTKEEKIAREYGESLFEPAPIGNRNEKIYTQCRKLFKAGLSQKEVFDIVYNINLGGVNPISEEEVRTTVGSAFTRFGIKQESLEIKPFGEWLDEWWNSIDEDRNQISLKFPLFDFEMKGKLRGKLCTIIHYGGTKKSLLAQNICHHNIFFNNQRVVYSSMEMGISELNSRFIDMGLDAEFEHGSTWIENQKKKDPAQARMVLDKVDKHYSDRLMITKNSALTCHEYRFFLDKVISENGGVDILVVDGLSMMGKVGKDDSETALVSMHTKELKEVAKDYNIFVIAIVHASKGEVKHTRDVSDKARGSEKIIDNCDFYICPSLIVDNSVSDSTTYEPLRGYVRLVNKRGSGNTVNVIYHFDDKKLLMEQSSDDPRDIDKQIKEFN